MIPDEISMEVSIPLDDDGYLDRECPAPACLAAFKIHADDWTEKVRDEEVFCPVCGHTNTSDNWLTTEQVRHCESRLMEQVMPMIGGEMRRMARDFNRRQPRGGLIQLSMDYTPSRPMAVVPLDAADLMRQRYLCEQCECRYAAIGAAFFCPSCGHNSARTAFAETLATIRKLPEVKAALEAALDRDAAANAYRLLVEENMGKIVGAFQRFAEATFESLPNSSALKARRNVFQNLAESSDLWEKAIGIRYEAMLTAAEWQALQVFFQQRHLLAHKDGLVDEAYLEKSGDRQYRAGQRLVIREGDVLRFATLVGNIARALTAACAAATGHEGP
jgi:hypothetical protein